MANPRGRHRPPSRGTSGDLHTFLILAIALLFLTDATFCRIYDRKWSSSICIQNYPAGASIHQAYSNAEHIRMNTDALSLVNPEGCPASALSPASDQTHLEEGISSEVTGQGHLAWESVEPTPGPTGRHSRLSRSIEDLTGVFSVQTFLTLFPNTTAGETTVAWLPCL